MGKVESIEGKRKLKKSEPSRKPAGAPSSDLPSAASSSSLSPSAPRAALLEAEPSVDDLIQRTELSARVDHLKTSTLRAIARRERLPQPLFWSLFHTEVAGIKKRRNAKRRELAKLFGCDWL